MKLTEFEIGRDFNMSEQRYRCTDKGSRVVVAIRIDPVQPILFNAETGEKTPRTLSYEEAKAEGLFNGPPYALLEIVIDEHSMVVCWDDEHPIEDTTPHFRRRPRRPIIGPAFYQD